MNESTLMHLCICMLMMVLNEFLLVCFSPPISSRLQLTIGRWRLAIGVRGRLIHALATFYWPFVITAAMLSLLSE